MKVRFTVKNLAQMTILAALFIFAPHATTRNAPSLSRTPSNSVSAGNSVSTGPVHAIFLVHGIAGNRTHFGAMGPALERALGEADPSLQFLAIPFEYETGSPTKTTAVFAQELGDAIHAFFTSRGGIHSGDRISFVTHSQGGLVGIRWLFHSFAGDAAFHPEYAGIVDSFITLGTPFWGAKVASLGSVVRKSGGSLLELLPFGPLELRDMSLGSDALVEFKDLLIKPELQPIWKRIFKQTRTLNVGGVPKSLKNLSGLIPNREEFEDDTAVPLPCARFDFIQSDGNESALVAFQAAHFITVSALHISPAPNDKNFPSLVQVPESCVKSIDCPHPTFKFVYEHLLGRALDEWPISPSRLTSFLLYIDLRTDPAHPVHSGEIKIKFHGKREKGWKWFKKPKLDYELSAPLEPYSSGHIRSSEGGTIRFYFTGTIPRRSESSYEERLLDFSVSAPGYEPRRLKARVRTTYTTFVDAPLKPEFR